MLFSPIPANYPTHPDLLTMIYSFGRGEWGIDSPINIAQATAGGKIQTEVVSVERIRDLGRKGTGGCWGLSESASWDENGLWFLLAHNFLPGKRLPTPSA